MCITFCISICWLLSIEDPNTHNYFQSRADVSNTIQQVYSYTESGNGDVYVLILSIWYILVILVLYPLLISHCKTTLKENEVHKDPIELLLEVVRNFKSKYII